MRRMGFWSPVLLLLLLLLQTGWGVAIGRFDPSASTYGANWPGDTRSNLLWGLAETMVWMAIIRPWSYRHAWARAAVASLLFLGWGVLKILVCMHCGPIQGGRGLWLLLIGMGTGVLAIVSLSMRRSASREAVA